jgi:hypothetical protein
MEIVMNMNPKWYEAANEASFKAVAAGYVFQSPNPWILARPRYYLVNEAQKAEISMRLRRWRLFLATHAVVILLIVASVTLYVTLSPATFVRLFQPAFLQLGLTTMIALAALLLAPLLVAPHIYLICALQPLLADAPRTTERITIHEQLSKIAATVPRWLLIMGAVAGPAMMVGAVLCLLGAYIDEHLARSLLFYLPVLVIGGMLTAYNHHLLRLKAQLSRPATDLRAC